MPVILILQIGAVTIAHHLNCNGIFPLAHIFCNIKFRINLTVLRIAHHVTVDPQIKAGLHTAEINKNFTAHIVLRQHKGTAVAAGQILFRHKRRIQFTLSPDNLHLKAGTGILSFKGIQHICVNRLSITVKLPVGRHWHISPSGNIKILPVKSVFHRLRTVIHMKLPHFKLLL